jgi:hydroxypyruvate isomerase
MPKFAANLTFLFTELAFLDRFKAARDAGFHAVEFMFPYDYKKEELLKRLHDNELELILHNLPAAHTIESNLGRISHIQVADNPGRHEPGTGEINYSFLFGFIDRIGYTNWIGCEYKPSKDTLSSLSWLKRYE